MSQTEQDTFASPYQETLDLYSGEEVPQSKMRDELREVRAQSLYESMERAAKTILDHSRICTVDELFMKLGDGEPKDAIYNGRTFSTMGVLSNPSVRVLMQNLTEYSEVENSLEFDMAHPPENEVRDYALTKNLALKVEFGSRPRIYFNVEPLDDEHKDAANNDALELVNFLIDCDLRKNSFQTEIREKIEEGESLALADRTLRFEDDTEELLTFVAAGLNGGLDRVFDPLSAKQIGFKKLIEKFYQLPHHYPGESSGVTKNPEGIYFTETGALDRVVLGTLHGGLSIVLKNADPTDTHDLSELDLIPGVQLDLSLEYNRSQDGNNIYREEARPFIETPTAAQLLASFEKAGLVLSQRVEDCFTELGEMAPRYGQGYADLTREVAKLVNDSNRSLSRMFNTEDEDVIKDKISLLEDVNDPAAQVVIEMLKGVISRSAGSESGVVLDISTQRIDLRDGSCKDAEVYVANGGMPYDGPDGQVLFKDSSYHEPSAITLRPVVLNGVIVPAGSLLAKRPDGYLLMRVTSFAFSSDEAAIAFGAQDAENRGWDVVYEHRADAIRSTIKNLTDRTGNIQ